MRVRYAEMQQVGKNCQTRYPYPEKPGPVLLGYGYGRVRVRVSYFYPRVTRDIHYLFKKIWNTCYINPRTSIPKDGSLHLAWEYANDPAHHYFFAQMLRVSQILLMF